MANFGFRNLFFTADTHYYHKAMVQLRRFKDKDEMNETLIERWNSKVQVGDEVYHLGDFAFAGTDATREIIWRLNGRIHLVKGNHDYKMSKAVLDEFESVSDLKEIRDGLHRVIILSHYPLLTWNRWRYGSWMLHGHCHGSLPIVARQTKRIDVGVDGKGYNFAPLALEEIELIIRERDRLNEYEEEFSEV